MLFLNFIDEFIANIGRVLSETVGALLNLLWISLCQLVYPLISWIFSVFNQVATTRWLEEYDLTDITNRVVLVLTIVMTFYVVFEFVKYTVSPDTITDKEKGAFPLVGRIVLAVIMLALVPKIFSLASELQYRVINTNVIGKVILGVDKGSQDIGSLGRGFTADLFGSFININCDNSSECTRLTTMVNAIKWEIEHTNTFIVASTFQLDPKIEFAGLLALIFGCFVLYVLFLYCKDVALRQIQMMFMQIMAPVAIMSYISPKKDGIFPRWVKQCVTTYVDIFIRLAVLYFMLLICSILGDKMSLHNVRQTGDGSQASLTVYLFLIAGLMMFMKKLPKLLQELFPSSGAAAIGFGFSAKDRRSGFFSGAKQAVARTAGAIAGIARGGKAIKNGTLLSDASKGKNGKINRFKKYGTYANALGRSAYQGFQAGKDGKIGDAIKTSQETIQKYETIVAKGGTVLGHDYRPGHYQDEQVGLQVKLDLLKQMSESKSSVTSAISEIKYRKQMESIGATLQARGDTAAKVEWDGKIKEFEKYARNYADGSITKVQYEQKVTDMINSFNATHFAGARSADAVSLDIRALETDKTDVYGAISTRMKEAKSVAKAITGQKIVYTVVEERVNPVTNVIERVPVEKALEMPPMDDEGYLLDEHGNRRTDEKTFADYIGDFTDAATTAKIDIESSDETKKIMTNAEGKK